MEYKLIIFDCDGVLVDSERLAHRIIVEMLQQRAITMSLSAALDQFLGKSTSQSTAILSDVLGVENARTFMLEYAERTSTAYKSELKAVDGIQDALDALRLPISVASSGEIAKMQLTLGVTGLLPRFVGRLTSVTEVKYPKPAPDVYLLAASRAGIDPADCLAVEDSPTGVQAAAAAKMTVFGYCALTPPALLLEAGAARVFDSMKQLPTMVSEGR